MPNIRVISSIEIKTKAWHQCEHCAEEFDAGTYLRKITTTENNKFETTYWCGSCWTQGLSPDK